MNNFFKFALVTLFVVLSASVVSATLLSERGYLPVKDSNSAYTPTVAYGEGTFLAVWKSGHLEPGDLRNGVVYKSDLIACRISAAGEVVDANPIVVADTVDLKESPKVVYGGNRFFVVWQDFRNGSDWDIYGARIALDGTVLDPNGFLISGGAHNQAYPKVAWDGNKYNVVWQDARSGRAYETYMARVSSDGVLLDPNGILVATGSSNCMTPAIAPARAGSDSVLVFSIGTSGSLLNQYATQSNTTGIFVSAGVVSGAPGYLLTSADTVDPKGGLFPIALAHGNGGYLLSWQNEIPFGRGNSMRPYNVALFNERMNRLKNICVGYYVMTPRRIICPDMVWDGRNYIVVWHEQSMRTSKDTAYDKVCAAIISDTGGLTEAGMLVEGSSGAPALNACVAAADNGKKLIAYEQQPDVVGAPIKIGYRMLEDSESADVEGQMAKQNAMLSLFPNPFNPSVLITVNGAGHDRQLRIFDLQGRLVADLTSKLQKKNNMSCTAVWNATGMSSAVYLVKFKSDGKVTDRRIFLAK